MSEEKSRVSEGPELKNPVSIQLSSLAETLRFGRWLGEVARPGDVICLDGDLGAGKTTLTQAIAQGLEVPPDCYVTSPSFSILHEYPGRIPLYHMDFYRLSDGWEVLDLGFDEYFHDEGLCVIEWSLRAQEIIPSSRLHLQMTIESPDSRQYICDPGTSSWAERLASFLG
ncbi:MAG: tRNA (adenosine(37)-N6)-threonylcarbamoyltransferase complex ATPase subunit type 1 TsaE [Desulfobulbaceae bacterium]|uniref:tRNA threonylcarbamoyladenosine biosynthesis protein TsaE n=1 Tax=Candidatus Desulfatifera sulfidica TaxID=2841691 RepID=A0A8J6TC12_9BACT|nr:tRNA (adenosine(37)-N6)-threonylcarbamoyltransferase complex ATPase subunit type 1 TsaE [Candidatus Desulfatifera sulfidica]